MLVDRMANDPRPTAELLRELIAKATKGPWGITEQGDLLRGMYESSMDISDARLIVALANAAEKLADVLEPELWLAQPPQVFRCRECYAETGKYDHAGDCRIAALDAAVRSGLEEGK